MNKPVQEPYKVSILMPWLQIILGLLFLILAAYKYVSHGYNFDAVNWPLTVIFGLALPIIAIGNLLLARKKARQ